MSPSGARDWHHAAFRVLLRLYPADFRRAFGPQMAEDFDKLLRSETKVGPWAVARLWLRTAVDVWRTARAERQRTARRSRRPGSAALPAEPDQETSMSSWWERLAQDVRYGLRGFRRAPVFVATAVLSLALGIGANTAIFSMFNALVLRPLPVRDPGALFQVLHRGDAGAFESSTYALYDHLKSQASTIEGVFQVDPSSVMRVLVDGQPEAVLGQQVTGEYFDVLGIPPVVGRVVEPRDARSPRPDPVVVLGHGYWERRFGGDPGVLGRTLTIDEVSHTIIGVTPREFFGVQVGRRVDLTVPIDGSDEPEYWKSRALVVRLAPGVSRETAAADLDAAFQRYLAMAGTLSTEARAEGFKSLDLAPASTGLPELRDRYGTPVRVMLAIVSLLLVMGCANLASLFLARAATRRKDLSVSLALGASRARLARQMLAETLVIAVGAGVAGVLAASWGVELLVRFLPDWGMAADVHVRPDRNVLLFGLALTVLTGSSIAAAPALLMRRVDIRSMLASGGRAVAVRGTAFKALIAVQVALSTVLVVAALLFAVTLRNLRTVPLGFVADGVLTLSLDADGTDLEGEMLTQVHREALQKLRALPGVESATFATIPPLSGNEDGKPFSIPGVTFSSPEDGVMQVNTVGPEFFETFGVRIVRGRGITVSDGGSATRVAVVSEGMARRHFPDADPIGRRVDIGRGTGGQIEIVGVAADVRYEDPRTPAPQMVYVPAFQREAEEEVVFGIRTSGDAAALATAATRELRDAAPALLTAEVETMVAQRDRRLVNERLLALLSSCLGALALLLAAIGVHGVVSYSVTQRTAELGLRIALGAGRAALLWLVIRGTLALVVVAGLLGVAAAFTASSLLSSLVFGIEPADPWVYWLTLATLLGIATLSAAGPTIRALRIDPIDSLRLE